MRESGNPSPPVMIGFGGTCFAKRAVPLWNARLLMDKPLSGHKIGFVGLGNMGRAMARHLHEAGAEVVVWNRSDASAEAAVATGMKRAATLPELARAIGDGVIGLNLTTTDVVEHVVFGEGGLVEGLGAGAMIIDFGTTGVPETKEFAKRIAWVDAPVSGGQVGAEAADLTIMAGAPRRHFSVRCRS